MVQSFIIHLDASTERKPLVEKLLASLPNASVVSAVYGRDVPAEDVAQMTARHTKGKRYPFDLLPGELGCFLSHRKVWQTLVDSEEDFALVCEDDAVLEANFPVSLDLALNHIKTDGLIRFPIKQREDPSHVIASREGVSLFRPKIIGLTTTMYLIGRDAARRLLVGSEIIDRPIDVWMQMRWDTGVDSLTVWPSHVSAAPPHQTGSTIQKKNRGLGDEIMRSIGRTRYRNWVSRKSKHT
jgi:GR25 family glycosyltransferase involved in LPS biosynthesis